MLSSLLTSYLVRLACFSFASFFVINCVLAASAKLVAPSAIRFAAGLRPDIAARFMLVLRLLPSALAIFAVVGLCLPSYLWLEPTNAREYVGFWCWMFALLGLLSWASGFVRAARSVRASVRYVSNFEHNCEDLDLRNDRLQIKNLPIRIVESEDAILLVAGVLHPRILVSTRVMSELSSQQLEAALRHESSHLSAKDNLQRFVMLLTPELFLFGRHFRVVEDAWTCFAEWAADDQAVDGDPERSVCLASALVKVARVGLPVRHPEAAICFAADRSGLSTRVDRLLGPNDMQAAPRTRVMAILTAMAMVGAVLFVGMLQPSTWTVVHQALERLVH